MPNAGNFTALLSCFFLLAALPVYSQAAANEPKASSAAPEAGDLRVYAITLPPQSMESAENGGHGILYELAEEAFKRAGLPFKPEFLPLARAQHTVRSQPNSLLIYGTRLPEREKLYTWVAPLVRADYVVVCLGNQDKKINSLEDAKALNSIGVTHNTAQAAFLAANGFTNLEIISQEEFNAEKLAAKRIDGWYTIKDRAAYLWKQLGHSAPISYSTQLQTQETWLMGSLDLSPELAARIRDAVQSVKADGTLAKIRAKYLGDQP
jgi:polar amino acid transport system substrate-binding protein